MGWVLATGIRPLEAIKLIRCRGAADDPKQPFVANWQDNAAKLLS